MDVTFVIPVRNDARRLARCLRSIREQPDGPSLRLVVVDNGSSDESAAVARDAGASLVLAPDVPVSVARNRGVAAVSQGDVIAFVDADHELQPGWLEAATRAMARPGVVGATAAYLGPPEPTWVQSWYAALRGTSSDGPAEWGGAGNLVVSREWFTRVGGFDETLEACEDVDLCFRLRQAGGVLWGAPGMRSVHHGDPPTLGRLFRGELWRGRDNLRVSLRGPWSARNLVSASLPVVQLAATVALLVLAIASSLGAVAPGSTGVAVASCFGAVLIVPLLGRATVLLRRKGGGGFAALIQALAVAATYDAARALALVWRARHHRARQTAQPLPQGEGRR